MTDSKNHEPKDGDIRCYPDGEPQIREGWLGTTRAMVGMQHRTTADSWGWHSVPESEARAAAAAGQRFINADLIDYRKPEGERNASAAPSRRAADQQASSWDEIAARKDESNKRRM